MKKFTLLTLQTAGFAILSAALILSGCSLPFVTKTLTVVQKVEQQVPVLESIINTITTFAAPEYAPAALVLESTFNGALKSIDQILSKYKDGLVQASPGDIASLEALVATIQSQLPTILPTLHVTDPETVRYATALVGTFNTVLLEIGALLPQPPPSAPHLAVLSRAATQTPIITAKQLKAQFNAGQSKVHIK